MEDPRKKSLERLIEAASGHDVHGAAGVARALDTSDQVVNNWKIRGVPHARALQAQKLWGVSAQWITTGEGPKSLTPPKRDFDENITLVSAGVRPYPVVSMIQAGHMTEMAVPFETKDGFDIEFGDNDASEWAVFVEIKGDSMLPEFRPGDRVRIDPEVAPRPGDFVAAKNSVLEATFKKYRVRGIDPQGNEVFELVPLNDDYPTLRSDEHSLVVIGTMTEHRRRFRRK